MNQHEQETMGYDSGLVTMDWTYSMNAEGVPWATICTTDITQANLAT